MMIAMIPDELGFMQTCITSILVCIPCVGQGTLLATNHEFDINTARGILNNKNYKH